MVGGRLIYIGVGDRVGEKGGVFDFLKVPTNFFLIFFEKTTSKTASSKRVMYTKNI